MTELDSLELGQQLRKPSGKNGIIISENMNVANNDLYKQALDLIQFQDNICVLEIGFGNGKFFPYYFQKNPNLHVFGIDYSEIMLAEAFRNNINLTGKNLILKCEDCSGTSFKSEFFDIILGLNTIYFWNPIEKHIEETSRILKKGGKLLLGFSPRSKMEKLLFTKDIFNLYESDEIKSLLEMLGFKILSVNEKNLRKKSINGDVVDATNICVLAEKII